MSARRILPQRRPRWRPLLTSNDDGAVLAVIAILMVVFIVIAAFAVDYGYAYANRRALSTAAEAAALAGARQLQISKTTASTCATLAATANASGSTVETVASSIGQANGPAGTVIQVTVTCNGVGTDPTDPFVQVINPVAPTDNPIVGVSDPIVSVTATANSPGFFGNSSYSLTRVSRAVVGPTRQPVGLRPLAVCDTEAAAMIDAVTTSQAGVALSYALQKTSGTHCAFGAGSGNWSTIDFDGGSNPEGDLIEWLANGYSGNLTAQPDGTYLLPGDPGANLKHAMITAMPSLLDKQITVPVYTNATASGGNVQYTVAGFIAAQLCGWQVSSPKRSGYGTCWDPAAPMPTNVEAIQVRFSKRVLPGDVNLACSIDVCKYSSLLTQLIG